MKQKRSLGNFHFGQKFRIRTIKVIDLCAGIGGFHHAFELASAAINQANDSNKSNARYEVKCVLACELNPDLRKLYLKNFPKMIRTYANLYSKKQALAADLDIYGADGSIAQIHGDLATLVDPVLETLREWPDNSKLGRKTIIPKHHVLCAGFPCQPFSKSGAQMGFADIRGTVFGMIAIILKKMRPPLVILENVGNFERHDNGNTWKRVKDILESLGYIVNATTHVVSSSESKGLLSPHHIGLPHHRERFFIVAHQKKLPQQLKLHISDSPFPDHHRHSSDPIEFTAKMASKAKCELLKILTEGEARSNDTELAEANLPAGRISCIDHWNELLEKIETYNKNIGNKANFSAIQMPSFPIWGFELDPWHWYPADKPPRDLVGDSEGLRSAWILRMATAKSLIQAPFGDAYLNTENPNNDYLQKWLQSWPAYSTREDWPKWKIRFIEQNRSFSKTLISSLDQNWLRNWLDKLNDFSASLQKLEWNFQGEELDLYRHILQFRPSGLRVKRLIHVPALVAMTTTQIPIVPIQTSSVHARLNGAKARYLLPHEALALQGFPQTWAAPKTRTGGYQAFGNAVHAGLVKSIIMKWLFQLDDPSQDDSSGTKTPR